MTNSDREEYAKATRITPEEISQKDLVFAFLGPTGTGKSTFVDLLTRQEGTRSGKGLKSVTREVEATCVPHPRSGERIVLVDTPGFDDTSLDEIEVLQLLADWLEKTYKLNIKLSGIVYLHPITDSRMKGSTVKNQRVFERLCGSSAMKSVVLTTTMWKDISPEDGEEREAELISEFWKLMIANGATVDRLKATNPDEAWRVVDGLIKRRTKARREVLQLQEELVVLERNLYETEAGKELYALFQELRIRMNDLHKKIREGQKGFDDPQLLRNELKELEDQLKKVKENAARMRIPLSKRILKHFKRRK